MVVVDAILQVLLLPSAAHFIHGENRRFDFPEMRPGPRESLYISQLSVLWITFWMDLRSSHLKCRSCLQTTVAALMSQPSSQTGPKKPSLFTANTLPESSSSPCLLSNSTDLYLFLFVLYFCILHFLCFVSGNVF